MVEISWYKKIKEIININSESITIDDMYSCLPYKRKGF